MPPGWSGARHTRWIGTLRDGPEIDAPGALDRSLAQSLAGIAIRIPPLRERPLAIGAFAADTALEWCTLHGERSRQFSPGAIDALRDYPWPGNLRELEAVLDQRLRSVRPLAPDPPAPGHEERLEALRALGYVEEQQPAGRQP